MSLPCAMYSSNILPPPHVYSLILLQLPFSVHVGESDNALELLKWLNQSEVRLGEIAFDSTRYRPTQLWANAGQSGTNLPPFGTTVSNTVAVQSATIAWTLGERKHKKLATPNHSCMAFPPCDILPAINSSASTSHCVKEHRRDGRLSASVEVTARKGLRSLRWTVHVATKR